MMVPRNRRKQLSIQISRIRRRKRGLQGKVRYVDISGVREQWEDVLMGRIGIWKSIRCLACEP
jgi:hypothetical protein